MGKYGKGMRDCCDSPNWSGDTHVEGCVHYISQEDWDSAETMLQETLEESVPNFLIRAVARHAIDHASSSQARLSEAVKVLEPFLNVRDQHPESVKLINGNMDSFTVMAVHVTKGQFLAAKAFLATLGEER